jgi:ABC-type polysaccharide/polyol phosphate export permease
MTSPVRPIQIKLAIMRLELWIAARMRPLEGAEGKLLVDIRRTWAMRSLAFTLAYHKAVARHRHAFLGAFWLPLGFILFAGGISLLWAQIFNRPLNVYMPWVTFGLFVWNLVIGALTDGARALQENRNLILQSNTPILIYPLIAMLKQTIAAAYNIPFVILVAAFFLPSFEPSLLLSIVGLALVWVFGLGLCVSLAIICTYIPDLTEIIASGLRFVFFFTPILWLPTMRGDLNHIWMWNPFYHLVEAFRGPLTNSDTASLSMAVTCGLAAASWMAAVVIYRNFSGAVSTRLGG